MLQQTQVERVIPYYRAWIKKFPTVRALGNAPLSDALTAWQGLGYNRRAKNLHKAATILMKLPRFPETPEALETLPGIGHYTARAIAAFAFNQDVVFVETNIRTALLHHFFPNTTKVDDKDLVPFLAQALPKGRAREWYSALMDYGSALKRSGVRLNTKVRGYTKQSLFKGSLREVRGAILRTLSKGAQTKAALLSLVGRERAEQVDTALQALLKEGMVERVGRRFRLAS